MAENLEILPARLKSARLAKGLSQRELAQRVGVDQAHISRMEHGGRVGTLDLLMAIARELDIPLSTLVGQEGKEGALEYGLDHPAYAILAEAHSPPGLRDLAADKRLVEALRVTRDEWRALRSIDLPEGVSKEGYLQLLITLRAVIPRSQVA